MSSPRVVPTSDHLAARYPFLGYLREYRRAKWKVLLAAFIAMVKHSPVILIPIYTGYILDHMVPRRDVGGVLLCALGMVGLVIMNIGLHPLYVRLFSRARREVSLRLRAKLCRRIQQLVFAYHDSSRPGQLHSKVMQDVEKLDRLGTILIDPLLTTFVTAVASCTLIIVIKPVFALVLATFLPLALLLMHLMRKRLELHYNHLRVEQEKLNAEVGEMINMLALSRAHATENVDLSRIATRLNSVKDMGIQTDWVTNVLGSQIWSLSQMVTIFVVCFGSWLVIGGSMTLGEVVMFLSFVGMTVGSISGLLNMAGQFFEASEAMASINEVLNHPEIENNDGKPEIGPLAGVIEFRDVWFSYPGTERPVLRSLNLKVQPHQTIALVGGSGAGKTTVVKLLLGFYRPIQGEIHVDGQAMGDFNLRSLRRQIGIVTQDTFLFNGTIMQNLTHGLENIPESDIVEAARQAQALEFISRFEKGFQTEIGERGVKLSGGQKQRIAIARALLRKPSLLILDEATSALDSESESLVQKALESLMKDRTTFVFAHRLSTVRKADRIIVFDEGRIVEDGDHDLLVRQGGVYSRLVELQALGA